MTLLEEARQEINACDEEMRRLFCRRMEAVGKVAQYKAENGMQVLDPGREAEVIARGVEALDQPQLTREYTAFMEAVMAASRTYQHRLLDDLFVNVGEGYPIHLGKGMLSRVGELLDLDRRVLVVTDSGVPSQYAQAVCSACKAPTLSVIPQGEASKSMDNYRRLLSVMLKEGFTRRDCVVAVGGGVVGDLAGFVASSYMRGVDFYNIPTTLLSQVDSSIGGKTAVDLDGIKNPIGAFKQPKAVVIDPATLSTLQPRQLSAGMAEVIKMATTHDAALFELLEQQGLNAPMEEVISAALKIKRQVVEADEKENGLRRVLNFGHTLGHGIESVGAGALLHGECVALGMLPLCSPDVAKRLEALYRRVGLPTSCPYTLSQIYSAVLHDKKMAGKSLTYVYVDQVGSFELCTTTPEELFRGLGG